MPRAGTSKLIRMQDGSMDHTRPGGFTRRRALQSLSLSAGALLSLGLWPGCATHRRTSGGNFRFLVINDTHYMTPECGQWLETVVSGMNRHSDVELCLLVGDLVEKGRKEHLGAVADIFSGLRAPVYPVIGNHDYLTDTDASAYDTLFAKRRNYRFEHRGWQFVGLDSSQGTAYEKTSIQPHTLRWLDEHTPKLDPRKPTVLFTHFPLGLDVRYRPKNADDVLDRFREFNLRAVFNGHFHGFTERTWEAATVTTNRCCALKRGNHDRTTEKGYFICDARDGIVTRTFIHCEMPAPAKAA